jgi:hypothetical protein
LERVRSGLKKPTAAVVDKQKAEHRMAILQGENNK